MLRASLRHSSLLLAAFLILAGVLRVIWWTADPPWKTSVGVVWHDEGAWVHNARNKALWGAWRVDEWNPVFIAPVFTAMEYASFEAFGVGLRQARLVSGLTGCVSVLLLALGARRLAGDRAALMAAALVATNYVSVLYDRAATMEASMVAFLVASWYCSTRAEDHPAWGAAAGVMAVLSYFTKAAAAFYLGALGLAALWSVSWPRDTRERSAGIWTLAGLAAAAGLAITLFVLPHWADYRFYNWQISVTRKPSYDLRSILQRLSWFPVLHDTFTRMWVVLVLGVAGAWGVALRWRTALTSERLLLLWMVVGTGELLVHDVGNERRFVFLIPVLIALAAILLARRSGLLPEEARTLSGRSLWLASPLVLYTAYVVFGPMGRLPFIYAVRPAVRLSAALASVGGAALIVAWRRVAPSLVEARWTDRGAALLVAALVIGNMVQYAQWATARTYKNYDASVALGRVLPPGTLVQGKLANGLDLENRMKPLFIGHGFGNFSDRLDRWDVRYILTYTQPTLGYEGSQILDVLDGYPGWRIVMTFDVAETPSGHDRAALIEKRARH